MVLSVPLLVHLFILALSGLAIALDNPTKSSGAAKKKDKELTRLQRVGDPVGVAPWRPRVPGLRSGGLFSLVLVVLAVVTLLVALFASMQ